MVVDLGLPPLFEEFPTFWNWMLLWRAMSLSRMARLMGSVSAMQYLSLLDSFVAVYGFAELIV
uniref:Uncharacterized protein n=1 Tax=Desertifilum tharense IPPAS B-1220 TaxID=1781255 RepID=A0ACD5H4X8_9CYAN